MLQNNINNGSNNNDNNSNNNNVTGMNALDFSANAPWGRKKKAVQEHPGADSEVGGRKTKKTKLPCGTFSKDITVGTSILYSKKVCTVLHSPPLYWHQHVQAASNIPH